MELNSDALLPPPPPLSALLERLWVVSMFSIFAFMQGLCWAIPGPISSAYSKLYGADAWMVQLYVNLGPIVYLPLSLPFALWLDKPGGVKNNTLLGVTLVTSGQVARMLASGASPSSTALLTLSFVLNAAAGPIAMGAVGKISEAFFPPAQRATATAVMAEANLLGMAGAMLFGPLIVRDSTAAQMAAYNYALLAVCLVAQAGIMLYFPAHPRVPPSASAALVEREEAAMSLRLMWDALLKLGMNPTFCVLSLTYGFATGMFGSWATVLSINLTGCSSLWVGWLSFSMTVFGGFGGIVMGRVADVFRHLKRTLVVLLALSSLAFLAFAALVAEDPGAVCKADGSPAVGMVGLFVLGSFGGLFLNSTIPLFYEMVLETSFPLPEATVIVMLTNMNNFACMVFLAIPNTWTGINWLFAGTLVGLTLLTQFVAVEKDTRFTMDNEAAGAKMLEADAASDRGALLA